jgi:hypothetical protein
VVFLKEYYKKFLLVFIVYLISFSSIIRANYSYNDDLGRSIDGHTWFRDQRWATIFLEHILQLRISLTDISPLPQILAIFILSLSSCLIVYIYCKKKIPVIPLLCSLFIGLNPFAISNWCYKFDSLSMSFSILFSIFPFLFFEKKYGFKLFCIIFCSEILVYTSYQPSSTIFLLMISAFILKSVLTRKNIKKTLTKSLFYFISYVVTILLLQLNNPKPGSSNFNTSLFSLNSIISGINLNIKRIYKYCFGSLNLTWFIFLFLFTLSMIIIVILNSETLKVKIKSSLIVIFAFLIMTFLSVLLFFPLKNFLLGTRFFISFGCVLSIISIVIFSQNFKFTFKDWSKIQKILVLPTLLLIVSFVSFPLSLGNALADQKSYDEYRISSLSGDLSNLNKDFKSAPTILISGQLPLSPVMKHTADIFPIINHMDMTERVGNYWGNLYFSKFADIQINNSINCKDFKVVLQNSNQIIKTDGDNKFCIQLK